jgi:hypothetical protein
MKLIFGVPLCALYLEICSCVLKKKVHKIGSGANDEGEEGVLLSYFWKLTLELSPILLSERKWRTLSPAFSKTS